MFARVINGEITEIVSRPNWFMDNGEPVSDEWLLENENLRRVLEGEIPNINYETQYHEVADTDSWSIQDTTVTKVYNIFNKPFEEIKSQYSSFPHDRRIEYETAGIKFIDSNSNELRIQTTRESQSQLMASYQAAKDGLRAENSLWKTMDGFVAISNADMIRLAQEVLAHVQACFDNEKVLQELVDAATTYNDLKAINFNSGWPNSSLINS